MSKGFWIAVIISALCFSLAWGHLEWEKWKHEQHMQAERAELSRQGRGHASDFVDAAFAQAEEIKATNIDYAKTSKLTWVLEDLKTQNPEAYQRIVAYEDPFALATAIRADSTARLIAKKWDFDMSDLVVVYREGDANLKWK